MEFENLMNDLNKTRLVMEEFNWSEIPENLRNKFHNALNSITDLLKANGNVISVKSESSGQ
jgi:hypothetical protein